MSTAVAAPVSSGRSWAHALRAVLLSLVIIVVVAASFALGRASATSTHATPAPASVGQSAIVGCQIGRPC